MEAARTDDAYARRTDQAALELLVAQHQPALAFIAEREVALLTEKQ